MKKTLLTLVFLSTMLGWMNQANAQCTTDAGTMGTSLETSSSTEDTITVTHNNDENLVAGDVLAFVVHNGSTAAIGTEVYGFSDDNIIALSELTTAPTAGSLFYVSAIAGPASMTTPVDLNDACTVVSVGTPAIFTDTLGIEVLDVDCIGGNYTLTVQITGGFIDPNGTGYTVNGTINGVTGGLNEDFSNPFTVGPLTDGSPYTLTVTDESGAVASIADTPTCTKCGNTSGTVTDLNSSSDPISVDVDSTIQVQSIGSVVSTEPPSILTFVVHTDSIASGVNIIAVSPDGTFSFADLQNGVANTQYYISTIIGPDADNNGIPDFSDACTVISSSLPATFTDDNLQVNIEVSCSADLSTHVLEVSIAGGMPPYTISGTVNGVVGEDLTNPFTAGPFNDGATYIILVTDAAGNTFSETDIVTCTKDCTNEPGVTPSATVFVCSGDSAVVVSDGIVENVGDTVNYILYTVTQGVGGVDTIDAILAISPTGTFSLADVEAAGGTTNTIYYVSAVVGPDGDGDGFPDTLNECFLMSTTDNPLIIGTPVVFLDPIVVGFDPIDPNSCDTTQGIATINIAITGGLPAFDGSQYIVSGTVNGAFGPMDAISFTLSDDVPWQISAVDGNSCISNTLEGITDCVKPLPIELQVFAGEVLSTGNLLKWSTATETQNDFFVLARSTDGVNYEEIATVIGAGNSIQVQNYSFLDKNAPSGISYYKLFQQDWNQTRTQVPTIVNLVRGEVGFDIVTVNPVPAVESVQVNFNAPNAVKVVVNTYDVTGRIVNSTVIDSATGVNTYEENIMDYAPGVYFISLNNGIEVVTERFVKK